MSAVVTPPPVGVRSLAPPPLPPHDLFDRVRRFTRDEYYRMRDAGILHDGDPVELLDGLILEKPMKGEPHEAAVARLTVRLTRRLPDGWTFRVGSVASTGGSEPEPDYMVLRGDETAYDDHFPTADEFGILVEVSATSLATDRRDKGRIYAAAGIQVYWIVNVVNRQVEVYTDPDPAADPPRYLTTVVYTPGQDVPIVLDGVTVGGIPAADLLP